MKATMKATEKFTIDASSVVEEYGMEALEAGSLTYAPDGSLEYDPGDSGVYDTSTPEGRRAWRDNAPEGVTRIVMEDGGPWFDAVMESFASRLEAYMEARGVTL